MSIAKGAPLDRFPCYPYTFWMTQETLPCSSLED